PQPVAGAGDAPFGLLAPARMVNVRVDVAVEAVLARLQPIPGGRRHALGEADGDDRLDALEAVLPRHHQPQRRAVLLRQRLAVQTGGQDCERMHRLVDAQALAVGPVDRAEAYARHLHRVGQAGEGDVLRLRGRRELPEYIAQRHAQPWDHHRPAFHAAQAVDALGRRDAVQQVVERQRAGALAFARDLDVPGRGAQGLRRPRRIRLAGAEL